MALTALPSRTVTTSESSTSTAHFSCPITTEANTTRQVQVATQTVTEKKVSHLQSGYMKGKKARFQIQPRQHNPNFTSQNSYQIDPNSGWYNNNSLMLYSVVIISEQLCT